MLVTIFFNYLMILISIAFVTLLERKILGYIHNRKGPNKIIFMGFLQPFSDALKLLTKSLFQPLWSNTFIYNFMPLLSLILMLMIWLTYTTFTSNMFNFSLLMIIFISSLSIYPILGSGWASNSKYALLGAYRGVAQVISYEVSFSLILLSLIFLPKSFNLFWIIKSNMVFSLTLPLMFILPLWMFTIFAEVNRSPYDFSESESELVSGFNIEFGSGLFTFLFLAEYGNILFFSYLTSLLFTSNSFYFLFFLILFLWVRGTLPRDRYDFLMTLAWKIILSLTLIYFIFSLSVNFY